MFADIVGFTRMSESVGPEQAYLAITGCLKLLDGIARKHGGSVDKYLGDALMIVFGHPLPIENAALAAGEAALEMKTRVRDYDRELALRDALDVVIGINSGLLVAGELRGRAVREFHVLGDTVNVAARLKARAPLGRIYVGPEVYNDTKALLEYVPVELMKLKGKEEKVPTFELVGSRGAGRPAVSQVSYSPFFGRDEELGTLQSMVRNLKNGKGRVVSVVGEEGIGKSRLLAEFAASNAAASVSFLCSHASGVDEGRDYQLITDLVRSWAGIGTPEVAQAIPTSLRRMLSKDPPEEAERVLSTLTALVREEPASRSDEAFAHEVSACLGLLLTHIAQSGPLVVAVDDLHRADESSLQVLAEILDSTRGEPILFVLAFRPGPSKASERIASLLRSLPSGRHLELALPPLDANARRQLVEAIVGEGALSEELRGLIEARAGGHPAQLVMAAFLAPALRSELEDSSSTRERHDDAERRRATILFADITGFTSMTEKLGAERAYPIVIECLELLDEVARRHGGTVEKYLGDCVMALFGIPEAIEDAPRAAMNAAIEMRRRVREYSRERDLALPLDVHTGINTGLGIAGDISGPMIREFAVMGDPVTVADRLKDRAPAGSIYVGAEAQRFTREIFEFRPIEPVELKGRSAPIPAFELLSEEERLYRARLGAERQLFSALVGRDAELGQLTQAVSGLREGRGSIISVIAEGGIGKSRLIAELEKSPEVGEVVWLEGRSLSSGQQLSFHPFADLCRSWSGITDEDDDDRRRDKIERLVQGLVEDRAAEVLPLIATVMGARLEPEARQRLERIQGDVLEKMIQRAVLDLLDAQSRERPVVLVMDDLHWADQSSIELLEGILRLAKDHPVLFLHLFRPGYPKTSERILEFTRANHEERATEIRLAPLGRKAARNLINNLFRSGDVPYETRRLIEDKAQGNPFYIEEVVRSLVDEGAVEYRGDGFHATEKIHSVTIPGTVQEVVMARVDRLPRERKRLLQVASVIGGTFHFDVLAAVLRDERLEGALDALMNAQFLMPSDRSPGVEYAFKHPLIQEVTYDGILQARREELHLKVAEAVEATLDKDVPGLAAMLAYHFSLGRDTERAEEYVFRAGDEAARSAASSEALQFFREASRLYFELHGEGGDPAKRALLQKNIARALFNRGELIDAVDACNQAMTLLGERIARNQREAALRFVRDLAGVLSHLYITRGRKHPAADEVQKEVIDLMYQRIMCQVTADAVGFLFNSVELLARLSKLDLASVHRAGLMYAGASLLFSWGGISFRTARRVVAQVRPVVNEEDVPELFIYRASTFVADFFEGRWDRGLELPRSLLEENLRYGRIWDVLSYLLLETDKKISLGDFVGAREGIQLNDQIWDQYQNDLAKSQHYYLTARLLLEQRKLDEALETSVAYYEEIPEDLLHIHALGLKSKIEILRGDLEAAEVTLGRCVEIIRKLGSRTIPPYMLTQYRRSRLLLDVSKLQHTHTKRGRRSARQLLRGARRSRRAAVASARWVAARRPEIFRLSGLVSWYGGRFGRALGWWRRSLEQARALGALPEVARTHLEIARRLADSSGPRADRDGLDAREHLLRAEAIFVERELEWDLAQLEEVRSRYST